MKILRYVLHSINSINHDSNRMEAMVVTARPKKQIISSDDLYLFNEGNHTRLYRILGAHPVIKDGEQMGYHFAVWAPNARHVSVIGDFNGWDPRSHALQPLDSSGIWSGFIPHLLPGTLYKYHIVSHHHVHQDKADPFAFYQEQSPATASITWQSHYDWQDPAVDEKSRPAF